MIQALIEQPIIIIAVIIIKQKMLEIYKTKFRFFYTFRYFSSHAID
jgi:hypothetical protein